MKRRAFWAGVTVWLAACVNEPAVEIANGAAAERVHVSGPTLVEGESYSVMAGVQLEPCVEGGQNVGWIDTGDWMVFPINAPAGQYEVEYRVASIGGGALNLDANAGNLLLGQAAIPATGGWQSWTTVSHVVTLPGGDIDLGIFASQGGWNLNWFRITPLGGGGPFGLQLVWEDDFDGFGSPDGSRWDYDLGGGGWGNAELQTYTSSTANVERSAGTLKINAHKDGNGQWTSARIKTAGRGDWTYGYFEIRARVPTGRGTWPAIWMLPTDWVYGGWPDSGEIDIMEHVGYDPDVLHTTIHTDAYNHLLGTQIGRSAHVGGMTSGFHTYGLHWQPDLLTWYVDGQPFFDVPRSPGDSWPQWPFDQRFHLILNVAIGGSWGGALGIDPNLSHATMEIDYVRVYQ